MKYILLTFILLIPIYTQAHFHQFREDEVEEQVKELGMLYGYFNLLNIAVEQDNILEDDVFTSTSFEAIKAEIKEIFSDMTYEIAYLRDISHWFQLENKYAYCDISCGKCYNAQGLRELFEDNILHGMEYCNKSHRRGEGLGEFTYTYKINNSIKLDLKRLFDGLKSPHSYHNIRKLSGRYRELKKSINKVIKGIKED